MNAKKVYVIAVLLRVYESHLPSAAHSLFNLNSIVCLSLLLPVKF